MNAFCIGGRKVWGRFAYLWRNVRNVPLMATPFVYILPEWHPCVTLFQWLTWYIEKHLGFSLFAVDAQANGEQHIFLTFLNQAPVPNCIASPGAGETCTLVSRSLFQISWVIRKLGRGLKARNLELPHLLSFLQNRMDPTTSGVVSWLSYWLNVSFFALCIQHSPKCCGRL